MLHRWLFGLAKAGGLLALFMAGTAGLAQDSRNTADDIHLITLDPGHFHASLFQKEMLPGVTTQGIVLARQKSLS